MIYEKKLHSPSFDLGPIPVSSVFICCCCYCCCSLCLFHVQFSLLFQTPNIKIYPALMDVFTWSTRHAVSCTMEAMVAVRNKCPKQKRSGRVSLMFCFCFNLRNIDRQRSYIFQLINFSVFQGAVFDFWK